EVDEKLHLKENEYEELKDDLEKKNKENEELQKDLTTAEGKLKLLEDEKNEIDGKFHLKENEYRKLKDDLEKKNKENEELQEDLATAEEKLKQLEDEKNEVDEKLHLKENEYRKLNDDLEKKNEENEELQEDLTSAKRKLKQLKDEKNEIDGKFHLKENECGKLKDDLGNKNKENEELSEEKKLQQKSIDFVNALLTATPMKKSSTDESIDNLVAFMKDEVKICLKNIDELENGYENNIDIWANLKKKTWIDNKTVISFVGEFSAGKTFIINKILEACDKNSFKLPEDPRPATAIPTYISKGDRDEFIPLFTSTDGVLKKITTDKFMNVDKELLSKIEASSLIQYFVLKYPNLNLQNLSILDTPGFDSGDEQDSERTLAVVNESHALFWVFEAGVGEVNQESLKIIKEHLKRPLYIVINNKNEDKSPKEIDDVETSVRKTLKNAGVNIKEVIRFSRNNINDLFKHIAGISIEKTMENDYLKKIKNKLEEKEKEFSKQLDNFNKEITEKENKLNEEINERERKFRNLKGALDDIKYAPKMENSFSLKLWKDKYAMSKEEYHIFNREIENSKNVLKNVKKDNKDIKGILDDLSKKTKEKEEIYKEFRKVKDCLERLGKISKDFI
ncbi:MAG: dynamin family protein, partial [Fibromonadales bacterium]|nr:dynamin family protein [Fibromonadales bacterium]